jgi:hypothetical protein
LLEIHDTLHGRLPIGCPKYNSSIPSKGDIKQSA